MRVRTLITYALLIALLAACTGGKIGSGRSYISEEDARVFIESLNQAERDRNYGAFGQYFAPEARILSVENGITNNFKASGFVNELSERFRSVSSYEFFAGPMQIDVLGGTPQVKQLNRISIEYAGQSSDVSYENTYFLGRQNGEIKITSVETNVSVYRRQTSE